MYVRSVTDNLRELIESIEPGVHQFLPLDFVRRTGGVIQTRWFWQICNRIDSIYANRPGWVFDRVSWRHPKGDKLVFESSKSAGFHFWHEKHVYCGIMISDYGMSRLNEEDISGFALHEYETI